jgi:3-methyladenine DNA glycosylase/8-oxoguanine DNA glycosylase
MSSLSVAVPARFSLRAAVVSHGWYLLAPFEWDSHSELLRRTEDLNGKAVDLTIRQSGRRLRIESDAELSPVRDDLVHRISRMLQLHVDLREFHVLCRRSPAHGGVAESEFGRLLCGSTLFEDAIKIIATTNTMWRQTVKMVGLLAERYGTRSRSGRAAFPTPEQLARVSSAELQQECRLGYRAKSIHLLASGIAAGSIDLATIADQSLPTLDLFARYKTLPGIGPYGAAHLLAMDGRHDVIAVDTEFRRFVRERYYRGRKVSDAAMVRRYAPWGRWKYLGYWSELWRESSG